MTANLVYLFFETNLSTDLSLIYEAFKNLPFRASYQQDCSSLMKIKLTEFLLWKGLELSGDKFASVYSKNLDLDSTRIQYNISANLIQLYKSGSIILQKSLDMLQMCKKYDVEFLPQNLLQEMTECKTILNEFLAFYKV